MYFGPEWGGRSSDDPRPAESSIRSPGVGRPEEIWAQPETQINRSRQRGEAASGSSDAASA